MKILVTGGTGHLGRTIVARLLADGHEVRVLARHPGEDSAIEWNVGDLADGAGVAAAVAGVDAVVHAATNSPAARRGGLRPLDFLHSPADVDLDGTRMLLRAAEVKGVRHFVHISIVGLEYQRWSPYARVKLAAEELVRGSALPWSIMRATPFYWLLDRMLENMAKRRILLLPADVHMEPVDSDDFAEAVAVAAVGRSRGRQRDFVGPEALTMREIAERYLAAHDLERRIRSLPLTGRAKAKLEAANTSTNGLRGTTTWDEWLGHAATVVELGRVA
jgi:uncharacterized protein YbjT (DUF2867 family)